MIKLTCFQAFENISKTGSTMLTLSRKCCSILAPTSIFGEYQEAINKFSRCQFHQGKACAATKRKDQSLATKSCWIKSSLERTNNHGSRLVERMRWWWEGWSIGDHHNNFKTFILTAVTSSSSGGRARSAIENNGLTGGALFWSLPKWWWFRCQSDDDFVAKVVMISLPKWEWFRFIMMIMMKVPSIRVEWKT